MPSFGEQPTSINRERLNKNEESAEEIKKQLAEAMASEDYDKVAELGGQMKSLKGQKEEFINKDEEEAHSENVERDMMEEAKTEDAERTKEKEEAVARAKELEELKLKDETESAAAAEEILVKIKGGDKENASDDYEQMEGSRIKEAEELVDAEISKIESDRTQTGGSEYKSSIELAQKASKILFPDKPEYFYATEALTEPALETLTSTAENLGITEKNREDFVRLSKKLGEFKIKIENEYRGWNKTV